MLYVCVSAWWESFMSACFCTPSHLPAKGLSIQTLPSNAEGVGSVPGQGGKMPRTSLSTNQSIKQKQHRNIISKDGKK